MIVEDRKVTASTRPIGRLLREVSCHNGCAPLSVNLLLTPGSVGMYTSMGVCELSLCSSSQLR